jgi:hypothetical protein
MSPAAPANALSDQRRELLDRALRGARQRFHDAAARKDRLKTDIALAEALQWCSLAFAWHGWTHPIVSSPLAARYVGALRLAWNVVKHTDAPAWTYVSDGMQFPVQFPTGLHEVCWAPFVQLPPLGRRHAHSADHEGAYRDLLQGRPCRFGLNVAVAILNQARAGVASDGELEMADGRRRPAY